MLTVLGLLISIMTAIIIAQGNLFVGGWLVLFAGIVDMFDGAMARVRDAATTFGAFLDSTLDRYSESIILLGLLVYALQHPRLQEPYWPIAGEQAWMITFIFVAGVGSLMVSYTKARAEGLGIECKTGLLARPERVIILALGLLTNTGIWALAILAVFSHVTAIERMVAVWRTIHDPALAKRQDSTNKKQSEKQDAGRDNRHERLTVVMNETQETDVHPLPTSVPPFTGGVSQE